MSIRIRLIIGVFLLLLGIVALAVIASVQVGRLASISTQITSRSMRRVEYMSQMNTNLVQWRGLSLRVLLSDNPGTREEDLEALNALVANTEELAQQYGGIIDDPVRRADYEAFLEHIDDHLVIQRSMESLLLEGRVEAAQAHFAAAQRPFDEMLFHIGRIRDEETLSAREVSLAAASSVTRSRYLFFASTLAIGIIQIGLGIYIWRTLSTGLQRLLEGTRRVARGDLSQPVARRGRDEFASLAAAFNAMLTSLKQSQEENQHLTQEALRLQEERINLLRNQFSSIVAAQEEERKRIARELHDDTAQSLVGLSREVDSLERHHKRLSPALKADLSLIYQRINDTLQSLRRFSQDLRPSILDDLGLLPALEWLSTRASAEEHINTRLVVSGTPCRPRPEAELSLFRIVQEALRNVAKHAGAAEAVISVSFEQGGIRIAVSDNGIGFDVPGDLGQIAMQGKLGLLGMQERARLLKGSFEIRSQPGQGTTVVVGVPREECCPPGD